MASIMSAVTSLPEAGGLLLMGSVLIVLGIVFRRVLNLGSRGSSANSLETTNVRQNSLELEQEKSLSLPVGPQI